MRASCSHSSPPLVVRWTGTWWAAQPLSLNGLRCSRWRWRQWCWWDDSLHFYVWTLKSDVCSVPRPWLAQSMRSNVFNHRDRRTPLCSPLRRRNGNGNEGVGTGSGRDKQSDWFCFLLRVMTLPPVHTCNLPHQKRACGQRTTRGTHGGVHVDQSDSPLNSARRVSPDQIDLTQVVSNILADSLNPQAQAASLVVRLDLCRPT